MCNVVAFFQTVGDFLMREKEYENRPPLFLNHRSDDLSSGCYDGMWTLAYALNETISGMLLWQKRI